jgi:hypothetical protein
MMLRTLVLVLGSIAVTAGALLVGSGIRGPGIYLICVGAVVMLGTAFERWRYRTKSPGAILDGAKRRARRAEAQDGPSNAPPAGARWERTEERFEDPVTGETMEVHYDRASGERRYVRTVESTPRNPS